MEFFMMSNLHSVGFTHFLTEASKYEQQIRSTPSDVDKVVKFINDNQEWMGFLAQHPSENRKPVKKLSERLREIGSVEAKEAANTIDQYLDVSLVYVSMKVDLPHTGTNMCNTEMGETLASSSQNAKSMRQLSAEVTIDSINKNRLKDLGFKNAEEAITFLINSPEKDRVKYVNFEQLPLNNEQFEKLTKNCPNLLHIEIPGSLISCDSLKHLAYLTELQTLNIAWCEQLERDALKHLANLTNLQSLSIGYCTQLERNALKHIANLKNLQSLTIRGCSQLERDALKHIANLTNLQSLNIRWCDQLEWDALKYIGNLKKLQSLDIGCCRQLQSDALKHIAKLTELQWLSIESCTQLQRDALKHIAKLTKLQWLSIEGCHQFEVDDLRPLADLKRLQTLEVGYCGPYKKNELFEIYGCIITREKLNMLLKKIR